MTKIQHLLAKVSEECHEVGQRAIKAQSFGMDEVQKDQSFTNTDRLLQEFNDLLAVMEMLEDEGCFKNNAFKLIDRDLMDEKKSKVKKYLKYAQSLGQVNNN